jgi:hypothetical protein
MEDTDLVQTGIGLLASVYRLRQNLEEGGEPGTSGYPELLEGALEYTSTTVGELAQRQEAIMRGLLMGFVKVVEAYERENPGPDVLQLLQQLSLEVAVE